MEFSSNELYEGKLVAWEGVKEWVLADMDGVDRDGTSGFFLRLSFFYVHPQ